ncbi:glycosyltransferase family 9 protein [Methylibium sp.]|uniref:glycosyltransferase family 9 protein n=1 Tax=Methylibium sp. TaxID=2067992 RepID=UPI0039C8C937
MPPRRPVAAPPVPSAPRLAGDPSIERVAVFRALMLGDMLCAVPALRALRAGLPDAEITLIGLPWMRGLAERLAPVDRFIEFPGYPGLPERACDVRVLPDFLAQVQDRRFDLAVQLHGSGRIANPLVASFGARRIAGFRDEVAWWPQANGPWFARWPDEGHEIDRLLTLTTALGFAPRGRELEFPVHEADRRELRALFDGAPPRRYACVHAGSQLPSRRWGIERFAAVADALAERGLTVVLTGGEPERELVDALARAMRHPALALAGRTSLWTLGALVEGAELVVCNDTGLSHVASALATPSVVVSCGADVARWAPLDAALHPVLWQPVECRPCAHAVCPTGHACASGVHVDQVLAAARRLPVAC